MKIKEMEVPVEEHGQRFDEDDDEDDDEGSYIEISLEAKPRWDKTENIFQFRLSFSTMLPRNSDSGESFRRKFLMHTESVKSTSSEHFIFSSDASSISSCSSSSSAVLDRSNGRRNPGGMVFPNPAETKSLETSLLEKENKWKKAVQFLAAQRLLKLIILNLRSSPESTKLSDDKTNSDTQTRKRSVASKVIKTSLTKLIINFRTIKAKSRNTLTRASNHISETRHVTHNTDRVSYTCYKSSVIEPVSVTEGRRTNKSKLPEVSKNSIKGMIDSLTVSCPASIKSSPVHRNYCATESTIRTYSRENSIQAAIAHCKMSLDRTAPVPDFSIRDK